MDALDEALAKRKDSEPPETDEGDPIEDYLAAGADATREEFVAAVLAATKE